MLNEFLVHNCGFSEGFLYWILNRFLNPQSSILNYFRARNHRIYEDFLNDFKDYLEHKALTYFKGPLGHTVMNF